MLKEFRAFIARGNVLDLAVARKLETMDVESVLAKRSPRAVALNPSRPITDH